MAFLLEKVRHVHSDDDADHDDDDHVRPPAFVPARETPVAKATKLPQGSNCQNLPTATAVLEKPMVYHRTKHMMSREGILQIRSYTLFDDSSE
eukprot:scaffold268991_cov51-Attheya_sp.AAC.1